MARSAGYTVENNFTNGLVTEATGLNFPENASTDTDNCEFYPEGGFRRRKGIDREDSYTAYTTPQISNTIVEYLWESVDGNGGLTFLVQQVGNILYFFNTQVGGAVSDNFVGSLSLGLFATDLNNIPVHPAQFATGLGKLVVTHPYSDPFVVTYDNPGLSVSKISIQTRDFKGLDPINPFRLGSLTPVQRYNLLNQGWSLGRQNDYQTKAGFYPSDYEVWWLYKSPDAFGTEVFLTDVAISSGILNNLDRGNSPAPKGSMILDAFYEDRSGVSDIPGIPVVSSGTNRPRTCAFHAGRVFYAGVNAAEYNSKIYFSQIIETSAQFSKCYQENDPTSQYSSDLLPSDGGVISIPEAGTIHKLWAIDTSILVFASTGVWQITGSSGIGFSAIDYTVKKISNIQTVSPYSFVSVNNAPIWWGFDSIYAIVPDASGSMTVKEISDEKIKTFYQNIPESSKLYVKGAFNSREQIVQWLYRDTTTTSISQRHAYTRILNLNVRSQAFYPWSIPYGGLNLRGIFIARGLGSLTQDEAVTDNLGTNVLDELGEIVTVPVTTTTTINSQFKYLVHYPTNTFTYANTDEDTYSDWTSFALPIPSRPIAYAVTGYKLRGEGIKKSQSNYLRIFNRGSGVIKLNSRWDYSTSGNTGRWPSSQRVVFTGDDFAFISRRPKIRGNGIAFQYVITSVEDQPFDIIGWSSFDTVNERP